MASLVLAGPGPNISSGELDGVSSLFTSHAAVFCGCSKTGLTFPFVFPQWKRRLLGDYFLYAARNLLFVRGLAAESVGCNSHTFTNTGRRNEEVVDAFSLACDARFAYDCVRLCSWAHCSRQMG